MRRLLKTLFPSSVFNQCKIIKFITTNSTTKIIINRRIKMPRDNLEEAKRNAAYKAVDNHIFNGNMVGVGSGSTIVYGIERLAERIHEENDLSSILCVPTSFQAKQLLIEHDLRIADLDRAPILDVCIDGADEIDADLNLIKGGGGCLLQEKIVASCTDNLIIIADYTKNSVQLGDQYKKGIPIEVVPMAFMPVKNRLERNYSGNFYLRMAVNKAGPVVTDNGNFLIDWKDFDKSSNWGLINSELMLIPGIVCTGLFINMAKKAYFGLEDGSVKIQIK